MCRTSHEVRGLKCIYLSPISSMNESHLTRGAWIEIKKDKKENLMEAGRTSHEVRGLKLSDGILAIIPLSCRTSHEVRGLKSR